MILELEYHIFLVQSCAKYSDLMNGRDMGLLLAPVSGFSPLASRMGYISYKILYLFKDDYNILKNSGFLFLLTGCYQG
jgi:hypothetical protein